MSRVNLLPAEIRRARRDAALVHRIRFFALCAILFLGGVYAIRTYEIFSLDAQVRDVVAQQASVEGELQALADVAATRDAAVAARALTRQLLVGEVPWSEQLLRIAASVPPGFTLEALAGQLTPDPGTGIIGSITFQAISRELVPTQTWLVRLAAQEGWANPWISSAVSDQGPFAVQGSVDLTSASLSSRGGA